MTPKHRVRLSKLSLGLIVALAAAPAFAQSTTSAGVGGTVVDSSGQPVANAEVVIRHVDSGTVSRVTTDESGRYAARGLRVGGPYEIVITKSGAGTTTEDNVYLSLNQANQVNVALSGDVVTLDTVVATGVYSGGSEIFSANKMGTGTNLSQGQIEALPSIDRTIQDLVRLDPRVAQTDKGRGEISVGGQNPRYNAIRIDGITSSDTFGLESNNFPTMRQPVSMDAIEAVNVDISNYDTTITGATGAVIDAVTKSGTNEFSGSVYGVYRDQDWVRDNEDGTPFSNFEKEETYGFTLGGPIVRDRLFFFANYEKFSRATPASSYGPIGSSASNEVGITMDEVNEAIAIGRDVYGIDIGEFAPIDGLKEEIEEKAVKIDWNISDNHRASFRYSELEQTEPRIAGSGSSVALNSRYFDIAKTVETGVFQLYSDWTDALSTEFKASWRTYDSLSNVNARLPQIRIGFGDANDDDQPGSPYLDFGADEFRHGNQINTETWNVFGAANWYLGDHTVKFGFDWEQNDIYNLYAQNIWGAYDFASLDHFRNGEYWQYRLNAPVPGLGLDAVAMNYKHRNLGLFVQDSWAVNYNLTLLFGLRVDMPDLDDVPVHNLLVQELYGLDNRAKLDSNLWQPRFGFNYTFDHERPTQLRGGLGLFQGAAANVWVGNSYQNHGFGLIGYNSQIDATMTEAEREAIWSLLPFNPDPDNPTTPPPAAGYQMMANLMEEGISQPSVWKANLAFDHELPWYGLVGTLEYLYTKTKDALHFERLDLGEPTAVGPDGRPIYWSDPAQQGSGVRANGQTALRELIASGNMPPGYENVTGWHNDGVIYMRNTDGGNSQQFTMSLTKPLVDTWGWSLAYTWTNASEVSPLTSSRAISNWNNKATFDPNEDVAATSNYEIRDRILGTLSFRKAFFGDYNTIFSVVYEGRSGRPHSWRFRNDMNGDGYVNDLLYIPSGPGDVLFTGGAEMEAAFYDWLGRTPELMSYAGGATPRNGFRNPWVNTFDIRISQELPGFMEGHKSELWLDIMNVGNLINKDWGQIWDQSPYSDMRAVDFVGIDDATGKYIYNFDERRVFTRNLYDNIGQSRWALQLGFRYKF